MDDLLVCYGSKSEAMSKAALGTVQRTHPAGWQIEEIKGIYYVKAWVSHKDAQLAAMQLGDAFHELSWMR